MRKSEFSLTRLALAGAFLSLGVSCFGPFDSSEGKSASKSASIRLVPMSRPTQEAALARRGAGSGTQGLQSFQVAIGTIMLAKHVDVSGTAWNNPDSTIVLYGGDGDHGTESITPGNAAGAANDRYYIDFMTAEGLRRISTSSTFMEDNLGDYNFVLVNWATSFRVRAAISIGQGDTVYTRSGRIDSTPMGHGVNFKTTAPGSLLEGPAETTVVVKNNGGTWFRFLRPLTIRADDLNTPILVHDTIRADSGGETTIRDTLVPAGQLSVMLVFNPDDLLTAWDSTSAGESPSMAELTGAGGSGNIHVPLLNATAVPYRRGEEIWRETYLFTVADNSLRGEGVRTRLELYLIGDNIVAASTRGLMGPDGELPIDPPIVYFAETGSDGTLKLQDYLHADIFPGFKRLGSVGATGTAGLKLGHLNTTGASYALIEKRKMN